MMTRIAILMLAAMSILILPGCATTSPSSPLHDAMEKNDSATARKLIAQGAAVDVGGGQHNITPLRWACFHGNTKIARLLIEKGANVNRIGADGHTPLSASAVQGNLEIARLLIEKGANVNNIDSHGNTPLHYAAFKGKLGVAKLLIEKGANVNSEDASGGTPLDVANSTGKSEVAKLLINKGAKAKVVHSQATALSLQQISRQPASVAAQDESNTPAECLKLIAALEACDQTGGFMAMGCKGLARSQFNCPNVEYFMR